jgi:hypothetical protein
LSSQAKEFIAWKLFRLLVHKTSCRGMGVYKIHLLKRLTKPLNNHLSSLAIPAKGFEGG